MPCAKLKVRLDGPMGRNATAIELNGVDIREFLRELSIELAPDQLNVAKITITVDELDLDAKTMAVLQAHVATKEETSPQAPTVTIKGTAENATAQPTTLAERLLFRLRFGRH
jgi:hypothetical protein